MAWLTLVGEGPTDEAVMRRLCTHTGHQVAFAYVTGGKTQLDVRLPGYNSAARFSPWFVLRDLDTDADCAPLLVRQLLAHPAQYMALRVPIHALEAWLLADRAGIARYLSVAVKRVPEEPEELNRPKRTFVDVARQSRSEAIRRDVVPRDGTGTEVGPGYTARIIDFATRHWNPRAAATNSTSLYKCIETLQAFPGL